MSKKIRNISFSKDAESLTQSAFLKLYADHPVYLKVKEGERSNALRSDFEQLTGNKWKEPPKRGRKLKNEAETESPQETKE